MPKLTEEQAGLLERILEEGLKAVTGEDIPVTVNLPRREPEYEYVTDGKMRPLTFGDWYQDALTKRFFRWTSGTTTNSALTYRRVEKKS